MRMLALVVALATAVAAHGQKPESPKVAVPPEWTQPLPAPVSLDPEAVRNWWRMFDDTKLASLVAEALESNLDLKSGEARLREARAARGVTASRLQPSIGTSQGYTRVRGGIAQGLAALGLREIPTSCAPA